MATSSTQPQHHHFVRTPLASFFGALALLLIVASLFVVWLNRTLTNTDVYVSTVAPLVSKPEIQDFVADKVTVAIMEGTPLNDLAQTLLAPNQTQSRTPEQLKTEVQAVVRENIMMVIRSPEFARSWRDTNRSAHQQFVSQLRTGSDTIELDLGPVIDGVISQLKSTDLNAVADKIKPEKNAGVVTIKSEGIKKAHQGYDVLQKATPLIVILALVFTVASVMLSVHHIKTLRRICLGSGGIILLVGLALQMTSFIKVDGKAGTLDQKAVVAIVQTLLHNLQIACVVLGAGLILIAIGSKIYEVMTANHKATL